ncbi:MAG: hypothetical protein JNK82_35320 [Myxococcaceae bacterium]|nr:hypothetical protein [Myxococcaceae bacterium]
MRVDNTGHMGLIDSVRSVGTTLSNMVSQAADPVQAAVAPAVETAKEVGHSIESQFESGPATPTAPAGQPPAAPFVEGLPSFSGAQLQNGLMADIGNYLNKLLNNRPPQIPSNRIDGPVATPEARAKYEQSLKEVSQHVADKKLGFPESIAQTKLPMNMWEQDTSATTGMRLKLKDGVKPSDAVNHFLDKTQHYQVDCATAQKLVQYSAMMKAMGPEKFDAWVNANGGMALPFQGAKGGALENSMNTLREQPGFDPTKRPPEAALGANDTWRTKNLKPGDNVYFDFKGAPDELRRGGYGGENAIYLGDGKYFAHPAGVCTEAELNAEFQKALTRYNERNGTNVKAELVAMQEIGRTRE